MIDHYEILGVAKGADEAVIVAAYRALAKKVHPDSAGAGADPARFALINQAYEILSDPERRAEYDQETAGHAAPRHDEAEAASSRPRPVQPAAAGSETASASTTAAGNFFWLVLGIPVAYVLGIVFADMLLRWILTVAGAWIGGGTYSVSEAIDAASEVIRSTVEQAKSEEPRVGPTNYVAVAFGAAWFFVCSSAAAGAIVNHSEEERPALSPLLVYASLFAVWTAIAALAYSRLPGLTTIGVVSEVADMIALLAGIVTSRAARPSQRDCVNGPSSRDVRELATP